MIAQAVVRSLVARADRAAVRWIVRRLDLPRPLLVKLLEHLAARVGAKLELTELP